MGCTGIVILNYNGCDDTLECVRSLRNISVEFITIVVDNNSTDDSYKRLMMELPSNVILIKNDRNLGYAGGNNIGIRKALELGCEYICILNNDTIVKMDFLVACLNELRQNKHIAFIGPAIKDYTTGRIQSAGAKINIYFGTNTLMFNDYKVDDLPNKIECDYVGGACIICRRDIISEIGLLPECYFLFYEETEWCYKAKKKGYLNICMGNNFVVHKGSVSIKKIGGLNEYLASRNLAAFIRRNIHNRIIARFSYTWICIREYCKYLIRHTSNYLDEINAFHDGWNKKIDLGRFPFIIIKDD